ncbi:DEAD/DEAH box helicase [uncultured Endozoicomonas sp.]|uniref:DEAD/DEAH box helicase n=1 Tax=uncultured Endozoicomonas sp. TaxID=432652 RepID=UPI00260F686C|nr:DEAD/DEAH box helicase [uncultured Endozoicomonas sp.]
MTFSSLGLSAPILKAVAEEGYETPSPIQSKAIPAVLEGRDVMAAAQTGTGKTAGFTLPILELLSRGTRVGANEVRTLILTPTRELAAQVGDNVLSYSRHLPLSSAVVYGGVKVNPQMMRMRRGADILVATPGRLLDLYNQHAIRFNKLEILVLDEADRMLDMGFIHDIKRILAILPKQRQTLMFSATFSDQIRTLAKGLVNDPVEISVSPRNTTAQTVTQWISPVDKKQKPALLAHLIKHHQWEQVLVFSRTKHGANKLSRYLDDKGITSAAIHGNKSQGARTKALADFKSGDVRVLVATDIAARGLDIDQLPQVVNFDLPNVAEDYVHRIGRTGRAGATGQAVSLICADEVELLSAIEQLIKQTLERKEVHGFTPVNELPETGYDPNRRPKKIKKPKQPKTEHQGGHRAGGNKPHKKPGSTGSSGRQTSPGAKQRSRKPRVSPAKAGTR